MKVFISYSRIDASETAKTIHNYLTEYGHHEVFIDTSNIPYGGNWKDVIQQEISNCDIFVIIVTPSALYRSEVEKEVELAKKLKKKIIPCIAKDYVEEDEIKWGLNNYQGFFYDRDSKLAMDLHLMIKREAKTQRKISTEVKTEIKTGNYSSNLEQQNSGETNSTQSLLERAKGLEEIEQYSKALKTYDETIKINPNNFEAHFNKGLLYERMEDFENARKALDKATDVDWKHKDVWYHLGKVLEKLERYDEALDAFNTDLRIDDKDVKSWTSKAELLEKMEKYEGAIQCFDNILRIDPNNSAALNKRKIIQEQLEKKVFEQKNEKPTNNWSYQGDIYFKQKNYQQAIEYYDKALVVDPNNESVRYNRFLALQHISQKKQDYTLHKEIQDTNISEDAYSLFKKGSALSDLGKYQEAIEYYDKALRVDPNYKIALSFKGNTFDKLGKYQEAIDCYDKALRVDPNYVYALFMKGSALSDLGKYQEAIDCYDKALRVDPNYKYALSFKGNTLKKLGKYQEAIDCYDKALRVDPNYKYAIDNKKEALKHLAK